MLIAASGPGRADSAQYFYDPAGRLTTVVDPINGSAQYNYDAVGNILSVVRKPITDVVVAQVSPGRGRAGDVVTIFGTGFGSAGNTSVSFNGVSATPTAVSATQITVVVPAGVTTGPVAVTSPAGSATSVANFIVPALGVPAISGVSPSPVDQGGTITIAGSNFDPFLTNNKVFINGRYARVSSTTASTLTVVVPTVSSGKVSVSTPEGTAISSDYLVVPPTPYLASNIGAVVNSSIGSSATVTIGSAGKIGLILFEATAGQHLAMQVTASSIGSGTIQLYGPDGASIGTSAGISNGTFIDTKVLPRAGTYAVLIAPGSTATGSATISLIDAPDVIGTIAANGTPVSFTTTTPGQNMRLTFSGTAGQRISLLVKPTAGGISSNCNNISILNPNATTSIFSGGGCPDKFIDVLTLPTTGSYTIVLDPVSANTGTAAFTLYDVPPDVIGTIAANGTPVSLTTTAPGQNMSLAFSGTAGQRISLQIQPTSGSITGVCSDISILQPGGTTSIFTGGGCPNKFIDPLMLPVTGSYTIVLNVGGTGTGTEKFTLYDVPPDVSGTIAANGTPVSLTTTAPGQNMSLTFSGTAGQRISLQAQATSGSITGICSDLYILQPDGVTKFYSGGGCPNLFSDSKILPVTGTYTILLNVGGAAIGTETFTLYNVPPDVTGTIATNGTPVSLTTTAPGQNMSLTFTGTAAQRVSLQAQATSGSISGICSDFSILQPDGVTKVYSGGGCPNLFSDVLILPVAGNYTIVLNVGGTATGTEAFTLYDLPPDANATITPGGGSVSLTTTTPGQNMNLVFNATAGQRVSLLAQPVSGSISGTCSNFSILHPNGTTRVYSGGGCPSLFSDVVSLPVTGSYTIVLNVGGTATGTETFTLYDVPPDAAGTTAAGQAAANYDVTAPGQAIQVTFTGAASQSVSVIVSRVSSTPAGACYNITTRKPDGTALRGDGTCSGGYSSGSLTLPVAGTYTVVVDPTSTSIGTFSVGVNTP